MIADILHRLLVRADRFRKYGFGLVAVVCYCHQCNIAPQINFPGRTVFCGTGVKIRSLFMAKCLPNNTDFPAKVVLYMLFLHPRYCTCLLFNVIRFVCYFDRTTFALFMLIHANSCKNMVIFVFFGIYAILALSCGIDRSTFQTTTCTRGVVIFFKDTPIIFQRVCNPHRKPGQCVIVMTMFGHITLRIRIDGI